MPIIMTKEVRDLIGSGSFLSPSLRLSKYAKLLEDKSAKRNILDYVCKGNPLRDAPEWNQESAVCLKMRLMGRMMVDQGGGVIENANLRVHRHFGYPFIPGSALKGIARHASWEKWDREEDPGKKLELAIAIAEVFGFPTGDSATREKDEEGRKQLTPDDISDFLDEYIRKYALELIKDSVGREKHFAGAISFLPGVPRGRTELVTEILNPHARKKEDKDRKNPVPIFFPAIEKGAVFEFTIIPLKRSTESHIEFAVDNLKHGLSIHGVGSKTAAGYGWFEEIDNG